MLRKEEKTGDQLRRTFEYKQKVWLENDFVEGSTLSAGWTSANTKG